MGQTFLLETLRKKALNIKKSRAKSLIYPTELSYVYCISRKTILRLIRRYIEKKILPPQLLNKGGYIPSEQTTLLLSVLGNPNEKYPNCLYKKDLCEAYGMNYEILKNEIMESKLDEETKQKIYHSKIIFPRELELIEKELGEPNISLTEMCLKRQREFLNR